jgi:enterochelin esterase family protein
MRTVRHDGAGIWQDRHGHSHVETRPTPVDRRTGTPIRVAGPLERAWEAAEDRERLVQSALGEPNPSFSDLDEDADTCLWTWVVQAPRARSVLLWANPVFDHEAVENAELTRLADSGLWTISLRLPTTLRAAYRIAAWEDDGPPPWRAVEGRREVITAARDAGAADPRAVENTTGPGGRPVSIAHGPKATHELWTRPAACGPRDDGARHDEAPTSPHLDHLSLGSGAQAWVLAPARQDRTTPLVVVFDGRRWKEMDLPLLLEQATRAGALPPVHLALLDVTDPQGRMEQLGVPGGQVDVLLDDLLPRVRAQWNVSHDGSDTIVAGQSLGGIAALWTLALGEGSVGHAIAQSPSLWRFDVAEPLLAATDRCSIRLQAGTYEGHMIDTTRNLESALRADPRLAGRSVRRSEFTGGHDWTAWRAELVAAIAQVLRD